MQVRCQRCGWMLTLGRDAIAWAIAQAQQDQETYHAVDCPRCRHVIKIQVTELRRRLPADYPLPEIPPPPQPEHKPKAESAPEPVTSTLAVPKGAAEKPSEVPATVQTAPDPAIPGAQAEPAPKPVRKRKPAASKPKPVTTSKPKKEDKPKKSSAKKK
jgi:hypothetical protein